MHVIKNQRIQKIIHTRLKIISKIVISLSKVLHISITNQLRILLSLTL